MDFDILIRGGLLADGSGAPLYEADLGINGDLIAATGNLKNARGAEEINARGLIVSPGFVDIHGHSDYFILIEPGARSKLTQGVTSEIGGNCGYSAAPISRELQAERAQSLDKNFGLKPDWETLSEYFGRLNKIKIAMNFGVLVGHNTIRASVMGGAAHPPDEKEMATMRQMVRSGMNDGALGISTGLVYPPACFADVAEVAALCSVAAEFGGFFSTHMRSEGHALLEAVSEVIEAAQPAHIRLEISHFKTSGPKNWGKIEDAIGLIEAAQARGVDVRCDRYPYIASYTGLSSALPTWTLEGTRDEFRKRLTEPGVRQRVREEVFSQNGANFLERVTIAQTFSDNTRRLEGLSVAQAAAQAAKDPLNFLLDLLSSEENDPTAIYHSMNEENMTRILKLPYTSVGSDSAVRAIDGPLGAGKPHPRVYGCFPRMLRLVREKKIMPIEEAVHKMTAAPAAAAGIKNRGTIRLGAFADVVVFDADKISDIATYENPQRFSVGVQFVIVNGVVALKDGEITGARAGKVLRRE